MRSTVSILEKSFIFIIGVVFLGVLTSCASVSASKTQPSLENTQSCIHQEVLITDLTKPASERTYLSLDETLCPNNLV